MGKSWFCECKYKLHIYNLPICKLYITLQDICVHFFNPALKVRQRQDLSSVFVEWLSLSAIFT